LNSPGHSTQSREHLLDLFDDWSGSERPLFAYDDGYRTVALSTRQTAAAARAFAATLEASGIGPGDNVVLWGENRPGWVIALWGCLLRGAVAVPIDARSTAQFVERVSRITRAKGIVLGDEVSGPSTGWRMSDLEHASGDFPATAPKDKDALAEILFTSGATAEPKGVRITHRNLLANLNPVEHEIRRYRDKAIVRWLAEPLFFPIRFLNLLPLSHLFGQTMAAFIPPMVDGEVIFLKGHHPPEIVRQVKRRRISVIVAVPKMLELLRDYVLTQCPEAKEGRPANVLEAFWRYRRVHRLLGWKCWAFVVGAAPLDPELEDFWRRLGYVVIQGYGLTETAPIVSLNHPFHPSHGTVGKPIPGVEMKLADDGEILVRGENITSGYYGSEQSILEDGWFHTGDVGEVDAAGDLRIRGRKKEMIVASDGSNIFPEDLERALNEVPGVVESAVVEREGRPHAVLVVEGIAPAQVLAQANIHLEPHQQMRDATPWPFPRPLPRTHGTRKLKRREVRDWLHGIATVAPASEDGLAGVLARYGIREETKLNELGLSSLERIQLLMELEERTGQPLDETLFMQAVTLSELKTLPSNPPEAVPLDFPSWTRQWWARAIRRSSLPTWVLPLARIFLRVRVTGRERLPEGPVLFAVNHQSYFDTAALLIALPARYRYRVAVSMRKEFFDAHYHPDQYGIAKRLRNSLGYYLACLMFAAFPLPQREAGTKDALRFMGELLADGWSVVVFPEGRHAAGDDVADFQPGIGMMAARLGARVVPVRLRGVHRVLHRDSRVPRPGRVEVAFGEPLELAGSDYAALARQIEQAVKIL
jgi:long-chain acyl-CoA synthetase